LVAFIQPYLQKKDQEIVNASDRIKIKYLDYDWSLNDK
jgi:hypothetical protein